MSSTQGLVSQLNDVVNSFSSSVNTQADKMHKALDRIDTTVTSVNQRMIELRTMIIEGEEKQLANENVLRIEQQINEQLASYQQTRRSVLGVIKDFDINLARGSTISKLSEELWMTTSRYWLSYAFIALSAWIQDDKELCENAVKETMRRDPVRASLFFCLLNLRFHRNLEAREWLFEFFDRVDPMQPPRETALLIEAYIYGVFSRDSQLDAFMSATMDRWINEINSNHEISAKLASDYSTYISNLPSKKVETAKDNLVEYCYNWEDLNTTFGRASHFQSALKKVKSLDDVEQVDATSDFIKSIDKLLDDLVNSEDVEEKKLRDEQKYYQIVMEHEGNVEAAKKEYAAYVKAEAEAESDIGRQMFTWAVYPRNISRSVEKFAMQQTKTWFKDAIYNYDREVRSTMPNNFKFKIGLWEDVTDGKDRELVKKAIETKYKVERKKNVIFTKTNVMLAIFAVVFLLIGCMVGMLTSGIAQLVGFVAGPGLFAILVAILAIVLVKGIKKYPMLIKNTQEILDKCLDEIEGFKSKIEGELAVKDEVISALDVI